MSPSRSSTASHAAAATTAARCSAARRRRCPASISDGEYDLAGFIVGSIAGRGRVIDGRTIAPGDAVIALPSSGLHTNGYSLARRIVFEHLGLKADSLVSGLGTTIGEALLVPHRSYLHVVRPLLDAWSRERHGAHHRRGSDRQPAARPAGRLFGPHRSHAAGRCRRSSASSSRRVAFRPTRRGGRSTWAWGSCW